MCYSNVWNTSHTLPPPSSVGVKSTVGRANDYRVPPFAVSMAMGMSCVALEDSTDEVAATKRHCRSLLVKLGSMVSGRHSLVPQVVCGCGKGSLGEE